MVLYGWELARDLMMVSQSPNSTISGSLRPFPRKWAIPAGPHALLLPSELIHIQASQRPASVKISLYTCQTFVPMTVKIAYVPVM